MIYNFLFAFAKMNQDTKQSRAKTEYMSWLFFYASAKDDSSIYEVHIQEHTIRKRHLNSYSKAVLILSPFSRKRKNIPTLRRFWYST
ncbi:hypothetical protein [Dokdonia pacifica]|uniref:hypothetical protein n=1 Tax=Dokdonia pacifica TaxID=1627892 RepID=UPI000B76E48D|nr:hypothetical protein [Dokdonia pacifica]